MGWTKGKLVDKAFGEIGLKSFNVNLDVDVRLDGLDRLDSLMAYLDAKSIRLGYPMSVSDSDSTVGQDSNIPAYAVDAVVAMLAMRLAPGYGKTVTPETKQAADNGFNMLSGMSSFPQQQQLPATMPRGAGNKPWRYETGPFMPTPSDDPLTISQGGDLDILTE